MTQEQIIGIVNNEAKALYPDNSSQGDYMRHYWSAGAKRGYELAMEESQQKILNAVLKETGIDHPERKPEPGKEYTREQMIEFAQLFANRAILGNGKLSASQILDKWETEYLNSKK